MMSKSQLRSRFSYCAIVDGSDGDGDAEALERRLVEQDDALDVRIRRAGISTVIGSPVLALTSFWLRTSYPASRSSRVASRRLARTFSGLPPTGLLYGVVKTSGGTLSRTVSRISSSCPCGTPDDASSVPSK